MRELTFNEIIDRKNRINELENERYVEQARQMKKNGGVTDSQLKQIKKDKLESIERNKRIAEQDKLITKIMAHKTNGTFDSTECKKLMTELSALKNNTVKSEPVKIMSNAKHNKILNNTDDILNEVAKMKKIIKPIDLAKHNKIMRETDDIIKEVSKMKKITKTISTAKHDKILKETDKIIEEVNDILKQPKMYKLLKVPVKKAKLTDEEKRLERNRKARERRQQAKLNVPIVNNNNVQTVQKAKLTDEEKRLERNRKARERRQQAKLNVPIENIKPVKVEKPAKQKRVKLTEEQKEERRIEQNNKATEKRKQAKLDAMDANDRTRMNIEKTKYEIDLKSFMRRLGEIPENVNTPHKLTEEEKATFRKFIELAKDSLRTIATKEKELTAKKWLTNAEINKLKQQYNFKQCLVKYENLQAVKNF